jgi:hypothetical protein
MEAVKTIQEKIAKKAYERFERRGKKHGYALEDWILAEKEVVGSGLEVAKPKEKGNAKDTLAITKEASQRQSTGMKVTSYA